MALVQWCWVFVFFFFPFFFGSFRGKGSWERRSGSFYHVGRWRGLGVSDLFFLPLGVTVTLGVLKGSGVWIVQRMYLVHLA